MNHLRPTSLFTLLLLASCSWSTPHGDQALPPIKRLESEPRGATVTIERLNWIYETPCDLPENIDEDEIVIVAKPGFLSYRGPLNELPQPARGTYRCALRRP